MKYEVHPKLLSNDFQCMKRLSNRLRYVSSESTRNLGNRCIFVGQLHVGSLNLPYLKLLFDYSVRYLTPMGTRMLKESHVPGNGNSFYERKFEYNSDEKWITQIETQKRNPFYMR